MDWDLAIKRNSKALKAIIEVLFALLGLDGGDAAQRIPRSLHSAVLRVLRPAESAVRRLIVVAARNVVVKLAPSRPTVEGRKIVRGSGNSTPSFQLFDPVKRAKPIRAMKFRRVQPRIRVIGYDPRVVALFPKPAPVVVPPPPPDGLASATRLHRRLQALKIALDDLPRQAKRLVRWQLRRRASPDFKSTTPLRSCRPPGYRRKPIHEVDEVLVNCDWLAWEAMKPDTS
ncbi:MAG: hypothetical protein K8F90_09705 [Hyphomicrobiales bacterium]|nr:hypothetical protein [Hyphomicrobiales bacterium]